MTDGTAQSRGDRNRSERLTRLRVLVPIENAIVGIDLADDKQAAVVTDHDSRGCGATAGDVSGVGAGVVVGLGP